VAELYVEQRGRGVPLVMLHGWGLHGGLWGGVLDSLAEQFELHIVDLPGHGRSPNLLANYTLENVAEVVAAAVPAGASWLGWSLGGRVALQAAATGAAIERLLLVGSNPCFTQRADWPHAVAPEVLEQFAEQLQGDYRATLQRFLVLQSQGSERGREEMRALRSQLFSHGEPDPAALAGGLEILKRADLRTLLPTIKQPTLLIHGTLDTLAPLAAAEYSAEALPKGELAVIERAGHAPFLSHPDQFLSALEAFFDG